MKSSRLRQKNEPKKKIKSKNKLVIIEEPVNVNSKFKNEAFKKLWERNKDSKEKLNTIEYSERVETTNGRTTSNIKSFISPRSNSAFKKDNNIRRNKLSSKSSRKNYYENLSKSRKNLLESVKDQDDPELYPTNVIRTKKVFRDPYNVNKYKEYPNLMGVLNQANYYNINDNKNYNDSIRYKPLDDIFNEQSSISTKKAAENNNQSPNMSFNSDFKKDLKTDQGNNDNNARENNIRKIKVNDDNNNTIDNKDENDINIKRDSIKDRKSDTFVNNGNKISPIISKYNSNEMKRENTNDQIGEYININTDNNENGNINDEINRNIDDEVDKDKFEKGLQDEINNKDKFENCKNENKELTLTPSQIDAEQKEKENEKEEPTKIPIKKDLQMIETINNFSIFNISNNNKNTFSENLKQSSEEDFTILRTVDTNKQKEKKEENKEDREQEQEQEKEIERQFNNLEPIKCEDISYIYKKPKNKKNIVNNENNDGKLSFNNDDEVLHYIKKKIREEKDNEYNKGKVKYNYFILTKKFHGKILYEIGLENDLDKINEILRKENVEVEHEPVAFITLKELNQLKTGETNEEIEKLKNEIENLNQDNLKLKEELEKMNQENKKLQKDLDIASFQNKKLNNKNNDENGKLREEIEKMNKENEKLKKRLDIKNKSLEDNNSLVNDLNKLTEEIEKLNEKNKSIENKLNEKQNLIDEYEKKLKEKENENTNENETSPKEKEKKIDDKDNEAIIEENKRLKAEREKFIKYINELQAYDEKVILEYQKVKKQLQIEVQKNNMNNNNPINPKKYFTNDELGIISNEIINILAQKKNDKKELENKNDFIESNKVINAKPEEKDELIQNEKKEEENKNDINNDLKEEKVDSNQTPLTQSSKENITENKEEKKLLKKNILKNEDDIDENKKKNKVSFPEKENEDNSAKNKREESMKKAMKRLENKRKRDSEFEEKNKLRKSEKISGLAQQLERTLNKGEGRIYVDEEYERNRLQEEEEEKDDNINE